MVTHFCLYPVQWPCNHLGSAESGEAAKRRENEGRKNETPRTRPTPPAELPEKPMQPPKTPPRRPRRVRGLPLPHAGFPRRPCLLSLKYLREGALDPKGIPRTGGFQCEVESTEGCLASPPTLRKRVLKLRLGSSPAIPPEKRQAVLQPPLAVSQAPRPRHPPRSGTPAPTPSPKERPPNLPSVIEIHRGRPLIFPQSPSSNLRRPLLEHFAVKFKLIWSKYLAVSRGLGGILSTRSFLFQNSRCFLYFIFFFRQPQPQFCAPPFSSFFFFPLSIHPRTLPKRVDWSFFLSSCNHDPESWGPKATSM